MSNTTAQKQVQTKKNKVMNTIVNVILVVAILFGAFCAFTAFVSRDETGVPSIFGICIYVIKSDSMSPTFETGDVIIGVKVKNYDKLKANSAPGVKDGDIITFQTVINGQVVLNSHRIVEKKFVETSTGGYYEFTTRGDNVNTNTVNDEFHPREVISKYLFHIPALGNFINFLQSSMGFFLVIFLPVALFFIWQIVQFFRSLFAYQAEKTRLQILAQMGKLNEETANPEANQETDKTDKNE